MSDRLAWPAAATRFLALRLRPGADLRANLARAFEAGPERAGFLAAAVGSLSAARLRPAGRDDALEVAGPLEIVALSGTFSADGPHLHLAVADASGAMTGGHLLEGCPVRTTAEVVLALADGPRFTRPVDPETGYRELSFR
jgi:predicted DNA-binding protein with PD1-like motif